MFGKLVSFLVCAVTILGWVRMYQKAGRQWWEAIVPIYNIYVLMQIAGKPGWWTVLVFIPLVNFVIIIIVLYNVCLRFGKGGWFTVGIIFLPVIFYPILGLGDAEYHTPQAKPAPAQ